MVKTKPQATITAAIVEAPDGTLAAHIERVLIGGGSQTVTVDGSPEERIHPSSSVYHVRFISPDRMVPDELRAVDTYDEAVKLGVAYTEKLVEHKNRVDALADDLKV